MSLGRAIGATVGGFLALSLFCALLFSSGCSHTSVKIDGSDTVYLITEVVQAEFSKEQPRVRVAAGFAGTGGGFKKFASGELDVCDASRAITDEERAACAKNGVEFVNFTIAFDGIAVVANPQNDWCDCLTVEQLKAIWQPKSAVRTWSDVKPDWPAEKIQLFGPTYNNGTFDYFTEAIVGKRGSSRDDYSASVDYNVAARGVAGTKYALAYFGLAYYEGNREKLKLLGVDTGDGNCVKPSPDTVRDKTYKPLARPLFIYVKKSSLQRPEVRTFVKFYLDNATKLAPKVGYIAVPDEVEQRNREEFNEVASAATPAK